MKYKFSVPIAPLRREPSDRSEMVSQGLMGEQFYLLERQEKWSMVRMHSDGYEGWVDNKQIEVCDDWEEFSSVRIPMMRCTISKSQFIWLPAGAVVPSNWIRSEDNKVWNGSREDIESCARLFLHAPYLWGGRTVMGIDCSGFTQLVMQLNGVSIPRDAYQQAEIGMTVTFIEESMTGDLAFFDNAEGRIIHVGLIVREKENLVRIIHASGCVRIDLLDHQGIFHSDQSTYTHKLRIIKRIVQ